MGLVVVMLYLAEIFTGDSKIVRQVVVAGGDDKLARAMLQGAAKPVRGVDGKVAVAAADLVDVFVLPDVELIVLGDFTVILQSLVAIGLLVWTGEGHVADF